MSEPSNYTWDFDRPAPEFMEKYQTFSVGVFQWVNKSSGKGIKKSKAIARVLGYVVEAERVYDKANELCARLNRESASSDRPPDWLQKQYSIPAPEGMLIERNSTDFTAAQVGTMRLAVMKEKLLPAGFIPAQDASYVRREGEQIHLINFQASKYGHEFTVNLAFHYSFIPPLFKKRAISLPEFEHLDCMIDSRIGTFLPQKQDTWFAYGENRDELINTFHLCADICLSKFHDLAVRWHDPKAFLADASNPSARLAWHVMNPLALGWLEIRSGNVSAAATRLSQWSDDRYVSPPFEYLELQKLLDAHRSQNNPDVDQLNWKHWVAQV